MQTQSYLHFHNSDFKYISLWAICLSWNPHKSSSLLFLFSASIFFHIVLL